MIQINGVAIATPSSFKVTVNDLDGESNRNARGELIRDRIAVKRKLECEWPPLSMNEISIHFTSGKRCLFFGHISGSDGRFNRNKNILRR